MPARPAQRRSASRGLEHLLIECVIPELDGGRYPVKRIVGDVVYVAADIIKDGHDHLAARVLFIGPDGDDWSAAPMRFDYDTDRWYGAFKVDRIGLWHFTVEGWTDTFATWRAELRKKVDAGQDVRVELLEGAALVRAAARRAQPPAMRAVLNEAARALAEGRQPSLVEQLERAFDEELLRLMQEHWPRPDATRYHRDLAVRVDRERARFGAWYEMFPRSQNPSGAHGTFDDAAQRLPRLAELGFDVVYLPPIHPIGRTFRKGKNNALEAAADDVGSPWAIGSELGGHTAVEPALGTIDDFDGFVQTAEECGLEVALDYALQCSPDHPWVTEHPDWFHIRPDGSIKYAENPPKKYQDIYPINFWCDDREALWNACRDVVRFWIAHGVKIFRVDNPHTKPLAFWEWMLADIQRDHPEVIFLAEAFTRPKCMKALAKLGFTQSYTYFTWKNTAWELSEYLRELTQSPMVEYFRGNLFANTPDILNEYLVRGGRPAFHIRLLLAATLLPSYGNYSGFELFENVPLRPGSEEYLDAEKYQIRPRDWEVPGSLNDLIALLNRIRREHPALQRSANLSFHASDDPAILFYRKAGVEQPHQWSPGSGGQLVPASVLPAHDADETGLPRASDLLIAVNLDPERAHETVVHVPLAELGIAPHERYDVTDLLTGARYTWRGEANYVRLDPAVAAGHVLRVER